MCAHLLGVWHLTESVAKTCGICIVLHTKYVTGYWKTDHNVTLGQLHFIGPANSHTHALSMHCCITGFCRPCKVTTETMEPMGGTGWEVWV